MTKTVAERFNSVPDRQTEWIEFQINVATSLYQAGFSDFMNGLDSEDTAVSYLSGYRDAKKIYGER